jgi:hypothetical protein
MQPSNEHVLHAIDPKTGRVFRLADVESAVFA